MKRQSKRKPTQDESARLLNRWVFDHAYMLVEEFNLSRSEAFRRAHLAKELLDALGRGEVYFEYEKKDGTLREAHGTLHHGISAKYDNYEYKTGETAGDKYAKLDISYWDLDTGGFRSFSINNIRGITEVIIK